MIIILQKISKYFQKRIIIEIEIFRNEMKMLIIITLRMKLSITIVL